MNDLLRALRSPKAQDRLKGSSTTRNPAGSHTRAPSFLSGGLPRDRRGRIAQKQGTDRLPVSPDTDDLDEGSYLEKDPRAALEALKSPDLEATHQRASTGGWGLGAGPEVDNGDEEEDEPLDWDQAQVIVILFPVLQRSVHCDSCSTGGRRAYGWNGVCATRCRWNIAQKTMMFRITQGFSPSVYLCLECEYEI